MVLYPRVASKLTVVVLPELGPPVTTYQFVGLPRPGALLLTRVLSYEVLDDLALILKHDVMDSVHREPDRDEHKYA